MPEVNILYLINKKIEAIQLKVIKQRHEKYYFFTDVNLEFYTELINTFGALIDDDNKVSAISFDLHETTCEELCKKLCDDYGKPIIISRKGEQILEQKNTLLDCSLKDTVMFMTWKNDEINVTFIFHPEIGNIEVLIKK